LITLLAQTKNNLDCKGIMQSCSVSDTFGKLLSRKEVPILRREKKLVLLLPFAAGNHSFT